MYELAWECRVKEDWENALGDWGQDAPGRLCRRGQQKILERWVFRRWIICRTRSTAFNFPFVVFEGEDPDFLVRNGNRVIGVEIAEACLPTEQAQWTQEAKEDETSNFTITRENDLADPERSTRVREMVASILEQKSKRSSQQCDELLLYLTTSDTSFETAETLLEWL
ncbi:MAG: hypothetical protein GY945_09385, partial [Rhodobacteraceae bacterium]|nr:hypothetical protein [Paracoccaceae bacterium]